MSPIYGLSLILQMLLFMYVCFILCNVLSIVFLLFPGLRTNQLQLQYIYSPDLYRLGMNVKTTLLTLTLTGNKFTIHSHNVILFDAFLQSTFSIMGTLKLAPYLNKSPVEGTVKIVLKTTELIRRNDTTYNIIHVASYTLRSN